MKFANCAPYARVMMKLLNILSFIVIMLGLPDFLRPLELCLTESRIIAWLTDGGISFPQIAHPLKSERKLRLGSLRLSGPFEMSATTLYLREKKD